MAEAEKRVAGMFNPQLSASLLFKKLLLVEISSELRLASSTEDMVVVERGGRFEDEALLLRVTAAGEERERKNGAGIMVMIVVVV